MRKKTDFKSNQLNTSSIEDAWGEGMGKNDSSKKDNSLFNRFALYYVAIHN